MTEKTPPAEPSDPTPAEPDESGLRRALWALYLPWTWGVFIPWLATTTLSFGTVAMGMAAVSPRAAFHMGTIWSWLLCRANFTRVNLRGRDNADPDQSYVIMSNHQSHFDVLAFYGHWGRQFRWVMKEELRKVPGLGWYCDAGGHVFIDRSDRQKAIASLRAAASVLKGGISVMFFPEGSRSRDGRLKTFKKGGFHMALDLGLPILPVSISGSRHVLPGKTLRLLPGTIDITVHEPVDPADYGRERIEDLMAEVRKRIASGLTPYERGESNVDA